MIDGLPNDKPTKVGPDITGLDVGVRTPTVGPT